MSKHFTPTATLSELPSRYIHTPRKTGRPGDFTTDEGVSWSAKREPATAFHGAELTMELTITATSFLSDAVSAGIEKHQYSVRDEIEKQLRRNIFHYLYGGFIGDLEKVRHDLRWVDRMASPMGLHEVTQSVTKIGEIIDQLKGETPPEPQKELNVTRKDYLLLSKALNASFKTNDGVVSRQAAYKTIRHLAEALKDDNPNFDVDRFMEDATRDHPEEV